MLRVVDHFRQRPSALREQERMRRKWFIASRKQNREKEHRHDQAEEALTEIAMSVVLATPAQVQDFHAKVDRYDEATIKVLMENQRLLDEVDERIRVMLDRAHKLDDGRRVFKTRDGTQVFDEHGQQIGRDVIDPDLIGNDRPYWEDFQAQRARQQELQTERGRLIEFQERLDKAREQASGDEITKKELDDLDRELEESMPSSVARHLPADMQPSASPDLSGAFKTPALPIQAAPANIAPSLPELR